MLEQGLKCMNYTILSYGQTGSGKSYSITGGESNPGVVVRVAEELFKIIANPPEDKKNVKFSVQTSYLEIYNEEVRDLLKPKSEPCTVRLVPKTVHPAGVIIEGLDKMDVESFAEMSELLYEGLERRVVAATACNKTSSRSHSIFTIYFTQSEARDPAMIGAINKIADATVRDKKMKAYLEGLEATCQLHLVDLAGSERVGETGVTGQNLKEACAINTSLSALGRVISTLAKKCGENASKYKHIRIPYRDSVLTQILSNSLGGNAMTSLLGALSPADVNYEETLSTLRYCDAAKKIKNKTVPMGNPDKILIKQLQEQVAKLEAQLKQGDGTMSEDDRAKMEQEYKDQLEKQRKEFEDELMAQREKVVAGQKMFVKTPPPEPHLLNLNKDDLMSESVVYSIDEDIDLVFGSDKEYSMDSKVEAAGGMKTIQLLGAGIMPKHAVLSRKALTEEELEQWKEYFKGLDEAKAEDMEADEESPNPLLLVSMPISANAIIIQPQPDCEVTVNGKVVDLSANPILENGLVLRHNDRVVIGVNTYFKFVDKLMEEEYVKGVQEAGFDNFKCPHITYDEAERELVWADDDAEEDEPDAQEQLMMVLPMIKEAKVLCKQLKRPEFVFSTSIVLEADGDGLDLEMKMTNTKDDISMTLTVAEFEERVMEMRELLRRRQLAGSEDVPVNIEDDPFFMSCLHEAIGTVHVNTDDVLKAKFVADDMVMKAAKKDSPETVGKISMSIVGYNPELLPDELKTELSEALAKMKADGVDDDNDALDGEENGFVGFHNDTDDITVEIVEKLDKFGPEMIANPEFMKAGGKMDIIVYVSQCHDLPHALSDDVYVRVEVGRLIGLTHYHAEPSADPSFKFPMLFRFNDLSEEIIADIKRGIKVIVYGAPPVDKEMKILLKKQEDERKKEMEEQKKKDQEEEKKRLEEDKKLQKEGEEEEEEEEEGEKDKKIELEEAETSKESGCKCSIV
eukprot:gnl/Carplike_NY0171/407_a562_1497.p1 GENE.gnl/Carplike_NY0171/407_a562_1497~~gnl/Carplike_NY0171/407_a562_1497.p1  ORF type:complete len:1052 (-),score=432.81 gnl/Carplike_NY0171/407_a562_1497:120-3023(-)